VRKGKGKGVLAPPERRISKKIVSNLTTRRRGRETRITGPDIAERKRDWSWTTGKENGVGST